MADDIIVGSVAVDINASARGFIPSLRAEIETGVRQLAENLSNLLTDKIAGGIGRGFAEGLAPADAAAGSAGRSAGDEFSDNFSREARSGVAETVATLPDAHIDVEVDTGQAVAELGALGFAADGLVGDASAGGGGGLAKIPGLASEGGSALGGMASKTGPLILGVGALATALIPLAGALGGVLVALAAPLGAAAVGGTLFTVLAGKFVGDTNKVAKQIDELKKRADTLVDPTAAQAARDQAEALEASLTGPQKAFLEAKQALSGAFDDLTSGEAGDALMAPVIAAMDALADILPALTPLIVSVSDALTDVIESVSDDPEAIDGFVDKLADLAGDAIRDGASILGSLAKSIDAVLTAASPTGQSALDGIADGAERLAEHLQSPEGQEDLQEFFDWLRENGPDIADAAVDISVALADLLVSLEPVGSAVLDGLDKLAELTSLLSEFSGNPFDPSTFRDAAAVIIDILGDLAGVIGGVLTGIGKIPKIGGPFREAGRAMKNAADDAHDLADAVRGVPSKKNVNISVPTKSQIAAVEALGVKIKGLTGKQVQIALSFTAKGAGASDLSLNEMLDLAGVKKHARGTQYAPGGLSLVGEEGPELLNIPRGSQVVPADKTAALLAGNSSGSADLGGGGFSPKQFERAISRGLNGATLIINGSPARLILEGA